MKLHKKALAVLLSAAVALSVAGCNTGSGGGDSDVTTTGGDISEPLAEATAPEIDEDAETGVIKLLIFFDYLSDTSDLIEEFEEETGGTFEQQLCGSGSGELIQQLGVLVAGGQSPDLVRNDCNFFPHGISYNLFTPLDSYIDINSDLWVGMKSIADQYVYNGKYYYFPYTMEAGYALNYNYTVVAEAGITDPITYVRDNTWTWEKFQEVCTEWVDKDPVNHIGYNGVDASPFTLTTGQKFVDIKDGEIINNLRDADITRCMQWLEGMRKQNLIGASADQAANYGWTSGYQDPGDAFTDGNLLFLGMAPYWTYTSASEALEKAGIPYEMKFVPFPRDEQADAWYQGSSTIGFLVPAGATNVKGAIDYINFLRKDATDPEKAERDKATALSTAPDYYPVCSNSDCGDTTENANSKGRHVFTDEENEAGVDTCPICGTARKERYKTIWDEEMWDLYQELMNPEGRFTLTFENVMDGFTDEFTRLFRYSETSIVEGPMFYDNQSYTNLVESNYDTIESYLQPYRDRMQAAANGEEIEIPTDVSTSADAEE